MRILALTTAFLTSVTEDSTVLHIKCVVPTRRLLFYHGDVLTNFGDVLTWGRFDCDPGRLLFVRLLLDHLLMKIREIHTFFFSYEKKGF